MVCLPIYIYTPSTWNFLMKKEIVSLVENLTMILGRGDGYLEEKKCYVIAIHAFCIGKNHWLAMVTRWLMCYVMNVVPYRSFVIDNVIDAKKKK